MNPEDRESKVIDDLRKLYVKHLRAAQHHSLEAKKVEAALKALGREAAVMASSETVVSGNGRTLSPSLQTLEKAERLANYVRDHGPISVNKLMHELGMSFALVNKILAQGNFEKTANGWQAKPPVGTILQPSSAEGGAKS